MFSISFFNLAYKDPSRIGNEFSSEKTPRNRLGTVSVIPGKKVLILMPCLEKVIQNESLLF
jgi:hypothetical protein